MNVLNAIVNQQRVIVNEQHEEMNHDWNDR